MNSTDPKEILLIENFKEHLMPLLHHNDKPMLFKNFVPSPENYVSWEEVETILNTGLYYVEILKNKNKTDIPYSQYLWLPKQIQNKEFIFDYINNGHTFVIHQFSQHNKYINFFTSVIESLFDVVCDAHIYGSIGNTAESFCPHVDIPVNFIFQVEGTTKWRIYNNVASDLLSQNEVNACVVEEDLEVLFEYDMSPGDMLYIPGRNYHGAFPDSQRLSISVPCAHKKYNTRQRESSLDRKQYKINRV